ncbi:DHA2 family efflux MFS transporter permease subunit [Burkholderia sp. RS02]|uniref:DHA2 family efflux MFS transporter permease subunit n=1 Tax=unclassified Burkholderia TaxID=2613784 RepID=UPI003218585D
MSTASPLRDAPGAPSAFDVPAPTPAAQPVRGIRLALLTFALSLATFIEVLDSTVTNVAVPAISGSLGVSNSQGTWVISSYSVAAAIAVPLTGWLARRVGELRLFVGAVLLFTLTSLLCGLARDLHVLVICRALQGLCSGPMVPLSQTILLRTFPPDKRTIALALWAMTVLLAPIFGPVVGGWIVDNFSWPWIFLINLPIGLFSFAVCTAMLRPDAQRGAAGPIDVPGIVLLVIGVGSLQAMLDLGHDRGWFDSPLIVTLAVVAALAIVSLLIWEAGEAHPVVDLGLFRDRTFSFCVLIISLGMMSFSVVGVVFPLWMQAVMGYNAFHAGLATASLGVLALVFSILVGLHAHRFDARVLATFGFLVFAAVLAWDAHFTLKMTFAQIAAPGLIQGIGLPCFFIPLTAATLSRIPDDRLAAASSLSNFLRTLSAAFGTAMSVTLWDNRATYHYDVVSQSVTHASANTQRFVHTLNAMGVDGVRELTTLHQVVMQQAYMMATNDMFWMASMTCLVLAAMMWLTRPKRGAAASFGH